MMFFSAICISGTYINNSDKRCQTPSFAIIVCWNLGLSDIINNTKKISARIKHIKQMIAILLSFILNDKMLRSKGTNKRDINPKAEPMPWIFQAIVSVFLFWFTLKIPAKIPAPIANTIIKIKIAILNGFEIEQYCLYKLTELIINNMLNISSHIL